MGRPIYLVAALAVFTPAAVGAGGFSDLDKTCTSGSLRACGSTEIGFAVKTDTKGAELPKLVVHDSKPLSPPTEKESPSSEESVAAEIPLFTPEAVTLADKSSSPTMSVESSVSSCKNGECAMVTPEPVTVALLATGLAGIAGVGALRRRRRT
jgi:hypothetical protein